MSYNSLALTIDELRKAADAGNHQAQAELSLEYLRGDILEQDIWNALEYMKLASEDVFLISICFKSLRETGDPVGYFAIALQWEYGLGVPRSLEQCVENLSTAAEKGHPMAMHQLGVKYRHGFGVKEDARKCEYWHLKALNSGISDSHFDLFLLYFREEALLDNDKALFHLKQSIESKNVHPNAFFFMGDILFEGKLVPPNNTEAAKWYLIAQKLHDYTPHNLEAVIKLISEEDLKAADQLSDEWIKVRS